MCSSCDSADLFLGTKTATSRHDTTVVTVYLQWMVGRERQTGRPIHMILLLISSQSAHLASSALLCSTTPGGDSTPPRWLCRLYYYSLHYYYNWSMSSSSSSSSSWHVVGSAGEPRRLRRRENGLALGVSIGLHNDDAKTLLLLLLLD